MDIYTEIDMRDIVKNALASLGERERHVLLMRFPDRVKTLQTLSDELDVGLERIRQIEAKARRKVIAFVINSEDGYGRLKSIF